MRSEQKKYLDQVVAVNMQIDEAICIALHDFNTITSQLNSKKVIMLEGECKNENVISELFENLQFVDAFQQRMNHIQQINKLHFCDDIECKDIVFDFEINPETIYTINFLQMVVATNDLDHAINICRSSLNKIYCLIEHEFRYFENRQKLMMIMCNSSLLLEDLSKHTKSLQQGFFISEKDELKLTEFYSIESERFVLNWCTLNPSGDIEQLLAEYQDKVLVKNNEEIDLF